MGKLFHRAVVFLLLFTPGAHLFTAYAQGTAFSYQGRLNDGGSPASGLYDVRFSIWDAPANGNLIAGPLTNSATGVTNGLFTVTLDFGAGVFTGPARWLELDVQTNGGRSFTTLLPFQPIMPGPYALMANTASNLLGSLPLAQLPSVVLTNGAAFAPSTVTNLTAPQIATISSALTGAVADSNAVVYVTNQIVHIGGLFPGGSSNSNAITNLTGSGTVSGANSGGGNWTVAGTGVPANLTWSLSPYCGTNVYYISNAPDASFSGIYLPWIQTNYSGIVFQVLTNSNNRYLGIDAVDETYFIQSNLDLTLSSFTYYTWPLLGNNFADQDSISIPAMYCFGQVQNLGGIFVGSVVGDISKATGFVPSVVNAATTIPQSIFTNANNPNPIFFLGDSIATGYLQLNNSNFVAYFNSLARNAYSLAGGTAPVVGNESISGWTLDYIFNIYNPPFTNNQIVVEAGVADIAMGNISAAFPTPDAHAFNIITNMVSKCLANGKQCTILTMDNWETAETYSAAGYNRATNVFKYYPGVTNLLNYAGTNSEGYVITTNSMTYPQFITYLYNLNHAIVNYCMGTNIGLVRLDRFDLPANTPDGWHPNLTMQMEIGKRLYDSFYNGKNDYSPVPIPAGFTLVSNGFGANTLSPGVYIATNAVMPSPLATGGILWNSNNSLYWITTSHTNLLSAP